jgi:hypothetical protein
MALGPRIGLQIVLGFAGICCLAGAHYANQCDGHSHRYAESWTIILLLAGVVFVGVAISSFLDPSGLSSPPF